MSEPIPGRDANTRERLQEIGRLIDEQLPQNWGFVLITFPFNDEPGRINYISNARREDTISVVAEWLEHAKQGFGHR